MKESIIALMSSIFLNTIFLDGASIKEDKFEIIVGTETPLDIASGLELDEIHTIYAL